ncbi:MAG: ATP-binding protein [Deltaproteobacteria bacterium]|nr:ATP-binding protein [Deltaproteobacteria bacterium]
MGFTDETVPPGIHMCYIYNDDAQRRKLISRFLESGVLSGEAVYNEITPRKIEEDRIEASLREKETLLKEIHHRVKNNLQVVSSLLGLQARALEDGKARAILIESQNRVGTMALIHSMLYQSENITRVDFASFGRDLIGRLQQLYGSEQPYVRINLDAEDVILPVDEAIPCGMILNELITNALKHAFPGEKTGEIDVRAALQGNRAALEIRDNGIGFPEELAFRSADSLGMQLVNVLVEQLNGTIDLHVDGGTIFTVNFSIINGKG